MKSLLPARRCCLSLAAAVFLAADGSRAQDAPEASPAGSVAPAVPEASPAGSVAPAAPDAPAPKSNWTKRAVLENELAMYSPLESPWADIRADHAFELRLFSLLRAEVRLWALQDTLTAQSNPARDDAVEAGRIVHEQILAAAADALPILQKTPNKAFALLLVHQLEAYPYEWPEEGSEQLLPDLHKLVDPPPGGSPTPRQRHRNNG